MVAFCSFSSRLRRTIAQGVKQRQAHDKQNGPHQQHKIEDDPLQGLFRRSVTSLPRTGSSKPTKKIHAPAQAPDRKVDGSFLQDIPARANILVQDGGPDNAQDVHALPLRIQFRILAESLKSAQPLFRGRGHGRPFLSKRYVKPATL